MRDSSEIKEFKDWLISCGALVDNPTSEWELLRVRTCDGTFVVYQNAKGKQTWPDGVSTYWKSWESKQNLSLNPDLKSRVSLRHLIGRISERDGLECWFCEYSFLDTKSSEITIEHLVALSHGGPNHDSNIVLACRDCNQEVGNKPVAEKALYREGKRSNAEKEVA